MGIMRDKRDKKSAYREQKVAAGSSVPQDGKGGRAGRKYLLLRLWRYLSRYHFLIVAGMTLMILSNVLALFLMLGYLTASVFWTMPEIGRAHV